MTRMAPTMVRRKHNKRVPKFRVDIDEETKNTTTLYIYIYIYQEEMDGTKYVQQLLKKKKKSPETS